MAKIVHVAVEKVQTAGLQTRVAVDPATVREYAEAVTSGGVTLPPIVVFRDEMKNLWIGDGIHRLAAAKQTGQKTIAAEVRDGGRADALRYALGANGAHGLRRTNADKAHAVRMAYEHRAELGLPEVPSTRLIAEIVGVNHETVARQLAEIASWRDATARIGVDGKCRELPPVPTRPRRPVDSETAATGRGYSEPAADKPEAPQYPAGQRPAPREEVPCPRSEIAGHLGEVAGHSGEIADQPNEIAGQIGKETDGPVDGRGRHVPVDLLSIWNRRSECQELATAISRVRVALSKINEGRDPLWWELNYQAVKAQLDQAYFSVSAAQPWCVCPMCQGIGCRACNNRGLMSQYRFKQVVPAEFKVAPPARCD